MSLTISAVIPTRNRPTECVRCVRSMLAQTRPFLEIVVVEAASDTSPLRAQLACLTHSRTVIRHVAAEQPGLTRQRNQGAALAGGDVILFTDDDTVLAPDCAERLAEAYDRLGPDVGGVQPAVREELPPPPPYSRLLRRVFLLSEHVGDAAPRMKPSGFPRLALRPTRPFRAEVLSGAGMSYRREVFARHQFDVSLAGYGAMEDIDFSYRVSRDFALWVYPAASLDHHPSPSGRDDLGARHAMAARNHAYLFRKNLPRTPRTWLAYTWASVGVLVLACINSLRWRTAQPLSGTIRGMWSPSGGRARRAEAAT